MSLQCFAAQVIVPHNMEVVTASCVRRKLNMALDLVKDEIIRLRSAHTVHNACSIYLSHVELDGRLTQNLMRQSAYWLLVTISARVVFAMTKAMAKSSARLLVWRLGTLPLQLHRKCTLGIICTQFLKECADGPCGNSI